MHLRLHQLFGLNFAGNDKITAGDLNREELVNAELFVQAEFRRRGIEHTADDELTYEAEELGEKAEKRVLAPVYRSGVEAGDEIALGSVLNHFKSFKLRMPFLYLVGGLANHGKTRGDIDLLVKGPLSEEMRRVVEFRLGRMLPKDLSARLQLLEDDMAGPFTDHYELADLVVEMRPRFERKEMRAEPPEDCGHPVGKQAESLLSMPKRAGKRDAVLQSHFRGTSLHSDLRMDVGPDLAGVTLATQKAGRIKQPVETLAEARKVDRTWEIGGSFFYKSMLAPDGVFGTPKLRQPKAWLKLEDSVFEPGSVGATRFKEGVIIVTDRPKVEWGTQDDDFHEWFFTQGKKLNGVLMMRRMDGGNWKAFVSKEFLPSILKRRALQSLRMPPDGFSWIPKTLEEITPAEFRYWKEKGAEARKVRDALIESRFFTARNVQMVGKEFRRVETVRTHLYVNKRVFPGGEPEGGIHIHSLRRDNNSTHRDGAHVHLFQLEDGTQLLTKEDGEHAHPMQDPAGNTVAESGEHKHEIGLPGGSVVVTSFDGAHGHQLQVATSAFDGVHEHGLELPDGRAVRSVSPGESWQLSGSPSQAEPQKLDSASEVAKDALEDRRELVERAVEAGLGEHADLIKLPSAELEKLLEEAEKKEKAAERTTISGRILKLRGILAEELPSLCEAIDEAEGFSLARDNPLAKRGEQRVAFGVVLEPETVDAQGDIYSAAAVRGAAERFKGGLGDMHRRGLRGAKILGSYIAAKAFVIDGEPVKRGTWLMLIKFTDRDVWNSVRGGKYTGLSIGGTAVKDPA